MGSDKFRSHRSHRWRHDEHGETLIELLVTVVVLSTAVVAIVGGLLLAVQVSDMHRKQAVAGAAVRAYAEAIQTQVAGGAYRDCGQSPTYTGFYTPPNNYTANAPVVSYWTGTSFGTCPGSGDLGLQQLTLEVHSNDNRASEKLNIVIRKPCSVLPC